MEIFNQDFKRELAMDILKSVDSYLEARQKLENKRATGFITSKQLEQELEVKYNTIQRWEKAGLRRYQPPMEETRKVYYRISDVLSFLGADHV